MKQIEVREKTTGSSRYAGRIHRGVGCAINLVMNEAVVVIKLTICHCSPSNRHTVSNVKGRWLCFGCNRVMKREGAYGKLFRAIEIVWVLVMLQLNAASNNACHK